MIMRELKDIIYFRCISDGTTAKSYGKLLAYKGKYYALEKDDFGEWKVTDLSSGVLVTKDVVTTIHKLCNRISRNKQTIKRFYNSDMYKRCCRRVKEAFDNDPESKAFPEVLKILEDAVNEEKESKSVT